MERPQKEQLVAEFQEIFNGSQSGILINFQGATVEALTGLRKSLFEHGGHLRVVKNSLAKIASQGTSFEALSDQFVQTRALVYGAEDAVAQAKVIVEAAKSDDNLEVIAGILVTGDQSKLLNTAEITDLSSLPSREELLVKILYLMNAPATNLVRTLNEVPAKFVRGLQAIADSKQS